MKRFTPLDYAIARFVKRNEQAHTDKINRWHELRERTQSTGAALPGDAVQRYLNASRFHPPMRAMLNLLAVVAVVFLGACNDCTAPSRKHFKPVCRDCKPWQILPDSGDRWLKPE